MISSRSIKRMYVGIRDHKNRISIIVLTSDCRYKQTNGLSVNYTPVGSCFEVFKSSTLIVYGDYRAWTIDL